MSLGVLGIDPSLTATGLCSPEGLASTVRRPASAGDERLTAAYHAVQLMAEATDVAVVEAPLFRSYEAGNLGMVHGVVRLALMESLVPYVVLAPATLKKYATGKGNATKAEMAAAVPDSVTGLNRKDNNQVDAWWLRQAGLQHFGLAEVLGADPLALDRADWEPVKDAWAAGL